MGVAMARFWWAALCVTVSAILAFLVTQQTLKKRDHLALSTVKIQVGEGHGSGVHTGNRYITTAAHVVKGKTEVKVKASHGGESVADVLWINEKYDIALLRARDLTNVATSRLSCSDPEVGQSIIAIGNPGPLEFIRAHGRVASGPKRGNERWASYYIVSMPVAPGMSGGPVLDAHGRVVGIVVGVAMMNLGWSGAPVGFGYIAPSSAVCRMLARSD